MQIDRILYPVTTLGPGKRVAIWTIGCPRRCKNCSNPELWIPNPDRDIAIRDIIGFVNRLDGDIDGITITGGEPFLQAGELLRLLRSLRRNSFKDILVYSGYDWDDLQKNYAELLKLIDVVVSGEYIDELNDNRGIRGSSNQSIIILNQFLKEKYRGVEQCERSRQNFVCDSKVISVGIPTKLKEEEP